MECYTHMDFTVLLERKEERWTFRSGTEGLGAPRGRRRGEERQRQDRGVSDTAGQEISQKKAVECCLYFLNYMHAPYFALINIVSVSPSFQFYLNITMIVCFRGDGVHISPDRDGGAGEDIL